MGLNLVSMLAFNRMALTERAVNSVLEQSAEDVGIVILDNASTDGTRDYLRQLQKDYKTQVEVLFSETNLGVAKGRNQMFRYILGNYNPGWILSMDDDCVVHRGYDTALTNCARETDADAICPRIITPEGKVTHNFNEGILVNLKYRELRYPSGELNCGDSRVLQRREIDFIGGTCAKTPRFFIKVGFYDEAYKIGWEDYSLSLETLGLNKKDFQKWREKHNGQEEVPLKELIGKECKKKAKIIYEPDCLITHDHQVREQNNDYEKIRLNKETISESARHFEEVWGVTPR